MRVSFGSKISCRKPAKQAFEENLQRPLPTPHKQTSTKKTTKEKTSLLESLRTIFGIPGATGANMTKTAYSDIHIRTVGISAFLSTLTVIVVAYAFAIIEDWTFAESVYYVIVTLTTTGLLLPIEI